jgi:transcriptional/translational regulatory protein YebC/TACO1
MAANGAVSWNFERKGIITVPKTCSDEEIFEKAIEAGAEDVDTSGEAFEITTDPTELHAVSEALQAAGVKAESATLTMLPKNTVKVEGKVAAAVLRLMELLEDHDDVQDVFANFDISEEAMAAAMGD